MANTERKRRLDAQKELDKVVSGQYLELRFPELFQLNDTGKKTQDAGDDTSSTTSTLDEGTCNLNLLVLLVNNVYDWVTGPLC